MRAYCPHPTLIEWDNDLPEFSVLVDEAARVDSIVSEMLSNTEGPQRVAR